MANDNARVTGQRRGDSLVAPYLELEFGVRSSEFAVPNSERAHALADGGRLLGLARLRRRHTFTCKRRNKD